MEIEFIWIYITAANIQEAQKISKSLVEKRMVACTNIIEDMQSFYWWQEKITSDKEVVIIAKSKYKLFSTIENHIKKIHSYEIPCIIAMPIIAGNQEYLNWIDQEANYSS